MSSRWLSFILRHQPESIGLTLDGAGWAKIDDLLHQAQLHGKALSRGELLQIVANCPKKRFTVSENGEKIRAAQGHSFAVKIAYEAKKPPAILYHGTAKRFVAQIMQEGLRPMSRQYVHLSADRETAVKVGRRHGEPVVLKVNTVVMVADNILFYQAENGVWLVEYVAAQYLSE